MGCFQVFEDHEGIEADLLRPGPLFWAAGWRPAPPVSGPPCWWSPPAPLSAAPSQPPAAPPCCPGIRPCRSWSSRQPAPSAMVQAPATPSLSPAGPETGCGWPSSGNWSPFRGRWWSGRSSPGGSLPASHPRRPWQWPEPFCCWGSPRNSSPPPSHKIPPPPLDKPTILIYNKNTPPQGGVITAVFSFSLQDRQSRPSGNSPPCFEFAPHLRRGRTAPHMSGADKNHEVI